jgi:cellulose biosynthesis protein BcsQ
MKIIAFFNNKGGVGKTSLVYHLTWMYAQHGVKVLAADLDPQANLTAMFLDEDKLESLWPEGEHPNTILGSLRPIIRGIADLTPPRLETFSDASLLSAQLFSAPISLLVGDLGLSAFEDKLSASWPLCNDRDESAFRVISAFFRMIIAGASQVHADVVLVDVGPNLGAINRAALIAADYVIIPLAPDLFSLQGLRNLGPTLRRWRSEWNERLTKNPAADLTLPIGHMKPAGYVFMQHFAMDRRPVKAFDRWMQRIPREYRVSVLGESCNCDVEVDSDPNCLAKLKHYRSLMPMAMEARKPMFFLSPADGAIGAHTYAVRACAQDFKQLAGKIATACGIEAGVYSFV